MNPINPIKLDVPAPKTITKAPDPTKAPASTDRDFSDLHHLDQNLGILDLIP